MSFKIEKNNTETRYMNKININAKTEKNRLSLKKKAVLMLQKFNAER